MRGPDLGQVGRTPPHFLGDWVSTWDGHCILAAGTVTGDSSIQATAFHLPTQTLGPAPEHGLRDSEHKQQRQARLSLTQLGVAKAEDAAIRPVDHRLDHLCHGSSTHLGLADTRGDTCSEWTVSNGEGSPPPRGSSPKAGALRTGQAVKEFWAARNHPVPLPLASLSLTYTARKPPFC